MQRGQWRGRVTHTQMGLGEMTHFKPSLIVSQPPLHQDLLPPSFHHLQIVLPDSYERGINQKPCSFQPQVLEAAGGWDLIKALLKIAFGFHLKPLSSDSISESRWTVHVLVCHSTGTGESTSTKRNLLLEVHTELEPGLSCKQHIASNSHIQSIIKMWGVFLLEQQFLNYYL